MALTQTAHSVRIVSLAFLAGLALSVSACDSLPSWFPGGGGGDELPDQAVAPSTYGSPCLETYGSGVVSLASTADGSRDFYISTEMPANANENAWTRDSRAVYEYDVKQRRVRPIASTWDSEVVIPPYATVDVLRPTEIRPFKIAEKLEQVQVGSDGKRIVLAVSRKNLTGGLASLYSGSVPGAGLASMHPGDGGGLAAVKVNDDLNQEAIQTFSVSPDGNKLAAIVGDLSEIRGYDLEADQVVVYSLGDENAITVSNVLPAPATSIAVDRKPAITANGARLVWAPDSTKFAYATGLGIGGYAVQILDFATGKPTLVHTFENTTQPQIAWAEDGASLFVVTTAQSNAEIFGDTSIHHLTAAKDGKTIGGVGIIKRQSNWKTVPSFLTIVGENTLLFTWEKHVFRFTAEGGDLTKATFEPLTERYPRDVKVQAAPIFASAAADRAVFSITAPGLGNRVGSYTHLSAAKCPVPTPEK